MVTGRGVEPHPAVGTGEGVVLVPSLLHEDSVNVDRDELVYLLTVPFLIEEDVSREVVVRADTVRCELNLLLRGQSVLVFVLVTHARVGLAGFAVHHDGRNVGVVRQIGGRVGVRDGVVVYLHETAHVLVQQVLRCAVGVGEERASVGGDADLHIDERVRVVDGVHHVDTITDMEKHPAVVQGAVARVCCLACLGLVDVPLTVAGAEDTVVPVEVLHGRGLVRRDVIRQVVDVQSAREVLDDRVPLVPRVGGVVQVDAVPRRLIAFRH